MNAFAPEDRIIVALDCDQSEALDLADALSGTVRWLKVGMTLFYQAGPGIVQSLRDRGFDVFLDLKLHDIPHQVAGAAEVVATLGAQLLTVHASGGREMIAAAVEGATIGAAKAGVAPPAVLAVTVLTSMDDATLLSTGVERPAADQVTLLARVASSAGADGIVCSPHETARMRALLGPDALVVTPGVRPAWSAIGDQARIATPKAAMASGASHLVIGRPITAADDPAQAATRILEEVRKEN